MTAPTRRQLMAGSLAAAGAAAAPAIAVAADPDERLRNAVQELKDAMLARWPDKSDQRVVDESSLPFEEVPLFMIACYPPGERAS